MQLFGNITPALLAIFLSTTSAAAAAAPAAAAQGGCIIPFVIFESLSKPFTLSALRLPAKPKVQNEFPVRIVPFSPSQRTISKPIISNARIASTQFTLKNQKLIAEGFEAVELPSIAIFPPVLRAFAWGEKEPVSSLNFTAAFACDSANKQYLQLRIDESQVPEESSTQAPSPPSPSSGEYRSLNTSTPTGDLENFVVKQYKEGEQVFIKPKGFVGEFPQIDQSN